MISMLDLSDQFVEDFQRLEDECTRLRQELAAIAARSTNLATEDRAQTEQALADGRRRIAELEQALAVANQMLGRAESDRDAARQEVAKTQGDAEELQAARSEARSLRTELDLSRREVQKLRQANADKAVTPPPPPLPPPRQTAATDAPELRADSSLREEIAHLRKQLIEKDNEIDSLKNQVLGYQRRIM